MLKKCLKCKQLKETTEFYKNRSKKDGLQEHCKVCGKYVYVTSFNCTDCGAVFTVNHRNVGRRKTKLCASCVTKYQRARIIKQNKIGKRGFTYTKKGYKYEEDLTLPHGYILSHRRIMSKFLGRQLNRSEVIHHIDGDKLNNDITNLVLIDDTKHRQLHRNLECIARYLYKLGLIIFDKDKLEYSLIKNELWDTHHGDGESLLNSNKGGSLPPPTANSSLK
jgi:hypothetical protein